MKKINRLINIRALVKKIMEQDAGTRNCDSYLYLKVISEVAKTKNYDLSAVSVTDYLSNMSQWGFPPFESVRRSRQKLQENNPDLASIDVVQDFRVQNEAVFREFARGEL